MRSLKGLVFEHSTQVSGRLTCVLPTLHASTHLMLRHRYWLNLLSCTGICLFCVRYETFACILSPEFTVNLKFKLYNLKRPVAPRLRRPAPICACTPQPDLASVSVQASWSLKCACSGRHRRGTARAFSSWLWRNLCSCRWF